MSSQFNSAPEQQNQPVQPETPVKTVESIEAELVKIREGIKKANLEGDVPGKEGRLRGLRNMLDILTNEQTQLSMKRAERFNLEPKEDVWGMEKKVKSVDPLAFRDQANQKRTLGDGSPIPEEFIKPDMKMNEKGEIEFQ